MSERIIQKAIINNSTEETLRATALAIAKVTNRPCPYYEKCNDAHEGINCERGFTSCAKYEIIMNQRGIF